jgi:hypothetical protein
LGWGSSIEILDIETGLIVKTLNNSAPLFGSITSVAFNLNGTKLVGGFNGGVALWEML